MRKIQSGDIFFFSELNKGLSSWNRKIIEELKDNMKELDKIGKKWRKTKKKIKIKKILKKKNLKFKNVLE